MINLQTLSRQDYQYVYSIFWRWFPRDVLFGKKTTEEKVELALELEREYRGLRNEHEFMAFINKLWALKQDGERQ